MDSTRVVAPLRAATRAAEEVGIKYHRITGGADKEPLPPRARAGAGGHPRRNFLFKPGAAGRAPRSRMPACGHRGRAVRRGAVRPLCTRAALHRLLVRKVAHDQPPSLARPGLPEGEPGAAARHAAPLLLGAAATRTSGSTGRTTGSTARPPGHGRMIALARDHAAPSAIERRALDQPPASSCWPVLRLAFIMKTGRWWTTRIRRTKDTCSASAPARPGEVQVDRPGLARHIEARTTSSRRSTTGCTRRVEDQRSGSALAAGTPASAAPGAPPRRLHLDHHLRVDEALHLDHAVAGG